MREKKVVGITTLRLSVSHRIAWAGRNAAFQRGSSSAPLHTSQSSLSLLSFLPNLINFYFCPLRMLNKTKKEKIMKLNKNIYLFILLLNYLINEKKKLTVTNKVISIFTTILFICFGDEFGKEFDHKI